MKYPLKTNGAIGWTELCTTNPDKAKEFYGKLFGWKFETMKDTPSGPYHVATAGDITFGGIMKLPKDYEKMPPCWGSYVTVANVDETAKKVVELGGKVVMQPTDIPGVGRFITLVDPQGAYIMAITYVKE